MLLDDIATFFIRTFGIPVIQANEASACRTFMLGFGFDEVNQSRSSDPDPLFSDPLHFRVESKPFKNIPYQCLITIVTGDRPCSYRNHLNFFI